jgi:hypothetical protein
MWSLWFLGDGVHHYPPLRLLEPTDMPSTNEKKRLSDLKVVCIFSLALFLSHSTIPKALMRMMEDSVKANGRWFERPTPEEVTLMLKSVVLALPRDSTAPKGRSGRADDRQWRTVLNQLQAHVGCCLVTTMPNLTNRCRAPHDRAGKGIVMLILMRRTMMTSMTAMMLVMMVIYWR